MVNSWGGNLRFVSTHICIKIERWTQLGLRAIIVFNKVKLFIPVVLEGAGTVVVMYSLQYEL